MNTRNQFCDIWNLSEDKGQPRKMYIKPNEIFTEERLNQIICHPTSNDIDAKQIINNERRKIAFPINPNSNEKITLRYSISDPTRAHGNHSDDELAQFPPVQVGPICTDKLQINLKVSKLEK